MDPADHTSVPILIGAEEPFFAGHFPGDPVVPGAWLLDRAIRELVARGVVPRESLEIGVVKFLRRVRPGSTLRLHWRAAGEWLTVEFEQDQDAVMVASLRARRP